MGRALPVLQPRRASQAPFLAELTSLAPEVIVVAAYGQILRPALLAIPPLGCINVHASLLPKYRGAAPINWALMQGERVTGVSIMLMDEALDTGPILLQSEIVIDAADDAGTLQSRLARCGAETLLLALDGLVTGSLKPVPQDHDRATYAPKLRKEDGRIDWHQSAEVLTHLIRGVTPWPGALTTHEGKPIRIWQADALPQGGSGRPGRVLSVAADGVQVETGNGILLLLEVQPANGRRMAAAAYARGHMLHPADVLGT
jgi:methionyl-tRNA formyltransferase